MKEGIAKTLAAIAAALLVFTGCDRLNSDADGDESGSSHAKHTNSDGAELLIYTWADYIDPDVIAKFEEEHNCSVIVDTFDSNESMYAKLKSGNVNYDIVTPSSYLVALMANDGLIQRLDHSKIPNVKANFDKSFAMHILDPSFTYNVPYAVTYTGFCYSKRRIPEGVDVASWSVLSDPRFRGKITLLNDIRETIGAGLMSLGYSVNSVDPVEISKAVDVVVGWCSNVKKFDSESYKTEVASGKTWIGHGYSTDSMQIIMGDEEEEMPPRPEIGFALPKEGFCIAFDEMVLCSASHQPDLAYAFINYLYTADVAKANMEYILGPMPVKPGIEALDEDFRSHIILPPDVIAHGQVIGSIESIPGAMELYNKAWKKIKAHLSADFQ